MKKYFDGCLNFKITDSFILLSIKEVLSLKKVIQSSRELSVLGEPRPRPFSINPDRRSALWQGLREWMNGKEILW